MGEGQAAWLGEVAARPSVAVARKVPILRRVGLLQALRGCGAPARTGNFIRVWFPAGLTLTVHPQVMLSEPTLRTGISGLSVILTQTS